MKCPNCDKSMDCKTVYSDGTDWDEDYPTVVYNEYSCHDCKVKCTTGGYYGDKENWQFPKNFKLPTEAQIKVVAIINEVLGFRFTPLLRNQCTKFISEHIQESKRVSRERSRESYYDESYFD